MQSTDSLLLIFVKHPVAGKAKTRLAASIGHDKALAIYRKLLEYTCGLAQQFSGEVAIWYGNEMPETDLWSEADFPRFQQVGDDLGARMGHAFQEGFKQGYQHIAIIGSDCATLTSEIIETAFSRLHSHDTVIGPAKDGGYYLLGMKQLHEQVFQDKNWSTDRVLPDTLVNLQHANLSHFQLPLLSDVDTVEDLAGTFLADYLTSLS